MNQNSPTLLPSRETEVPVPHVSKIICDILDIYVLLFS